MTYTYKLCKNVSVNLNYELELRERLAPGVGRGVRGSEAAPWSCDRPSGQALPPYPHPGKTDVYI